MEFRRLACGAALSAALLLLFGSRTTVRANDLPTGMKPVPARPLEQFRLKMHHLHTGEDIDVVYKIGNEYVPSAVEKLNHFLRDHRTGDVATYDPKEFDTLHSLLAKLGKQNGVIDIVCGYRTPWSNNFLRGRSANTGVAKNSQHMQAKAIDIRVPGVTTARLRETALSLHAGGVGYYPVSQFVHVDVGPVRQWTYGAAHND
ncbi:DUF882 domain-containing protein [Terriglobus tenax]|uniref:DUF882 domain-containing protein n=1 Tax=Terriglobus tenax TaxID=1111115 RepID=UPI0021DF51AE|nr:DUF882 domain-containing protein [Terriglobus tenax]